MTNIRDSISRQVSACPDERSRITLLPTAVRLTHGGVCDAGVLLQEERRVGDLALLGRGDRRLVVREVHGRDAGLGGRDDGRELAEVDVAERQVAGCAEAFRELVLENGVAGVGVGFVGLGLRAAAVGEDERGEGHEREAEEREFVHVGLLWVWVDVESGRAKKWKSGKG